MNNQINGYKLTGIATRKDVERLLGESIPQFCNDNPDIMFIRGHIGGYYIQKLRQLKVLDLWFTPVYEEVNSWLKPADIVMYEKFGMMTPDNKKPFQVYIKPTIISTRTITL